VPPKELRALVSAAVAFVAGPVW